MSSLEAEGKQLGGNKEMKMPGGKFHEHKKTEKEMKTVEMEYHVRGARARGAARGAASAEAPHAPMMQTRAASRGVLTLCCGRVPTRRS